MNEPLRPARFPTTHWIRLEPDLAEAHHRLGFFLEKNGYPAGSMAEAREAIRLQPHHVRAYNNLAFNAA
jgi:hypothetical protein